jgi:putative FmdB family regulatory protein
MPIYEFYCARCHTVFHFLSRTVSPTREPACPRCAQPRLERRPSSFAISKGRKEPGEGGGDVDEARLEQAMEQMALEGGGLDEDDPKSAARFLRKLYQTAGLEPGAGLTEALARLEAGEDPDAIEEDLGDVLDAEPGPGNGEQGRTGTLRRRFLPPRIDPELHEL